MRSLRLPPRRLTSSSATPTAATITKPLGLCPPVEADETGKAGMGRTDSIWNELNVIGVTPGIYNDTVSITKANADVYNPEFIAAMQQALINVINTPEGQEIFSVYSHTGYAVATDADYDGARAALKVAQ